MSGCARFTRVSKLPIRWWWTLTNGWGRRWASEPLWCVIAACCNGPSPRAHRITWKVPFWSKPNRWARGSISILWMDSAFPTVISGWSCRPHPEERWCGPCCGKLVPTAWRNAFAVITIWPAVWRSRLWPILDWSCCRHPPCPSAVFVIGWSSAPI